MYQIGISSQASTVLAVNHNIWPHFVTGPPRPEISIAIKQRAIKFVKGVLFALTCEQ